jgi:DNA-binding CsgD family transcriptional regulator
MRPVAGSTPPLAGRCEELARLRDAVDTAGSGVPVLVTLRGEPGIGKTRLLAELSRMAAAAGMSVAAGRATERERPVPFAPFAAVADLVVELAGGLDPSRLADWAGSSPIGRYRALRAVRGALGKAVRRHSVAVLLDDLHWADDASLDLLQQLLSHPPDGRLLVAVAYRPRQATDRVGALAAGTHLSVRTVDLEPGPLSRQEVRELLAGRPIPAGLFEAAGGNPLYARLLAGAGMPTVLLGELTPLDGEQTRVLRAAAVVGDPFEPDLVTAVSGGDAAPVLDTLVGRDLLRPADHAGRRLRFRHPLLAAAVYGAAPPAWRLDAHRRAAEVLRCRGADPIALAPHLCRTAGAGDTAAVDVLHEAAGRIAVLAPATAAGWLAEAERLAGPDAGPDRRADLILAQARARISAGQVLACRDLMVDLLDWLPTAHRRWVDAVAMAGLAERLLGGADSTYALLGAELTQVPETSLAVIADHAAGGALLRRSRDAGALAARALAAAGDAEPQVRAAVQATAAMAAACHGSMAAAADWVGAASAVVDGHRDQALRGPLDPIGQLAWAEVMLERDTLALRHFGRALEVASRFGQGYLRPHLLLGQSHVLGRRGALAQAVQAADEAEEEARQFDGTVLLPVALAFRAEAMLWQAGPVEALRHAERAVRAGGEPDHDWCSSLARRVLAWVTLRAGDPRTARALLLSAAGGPGLPRAEVFSRARWLHVLAEAEVAIGDHAAAAAAAAEAIGAAAAAGLAGQRGHALLATARVEADPGSAAEVAGQAAAMFAEAGHPLDEAQAWLVAAAAARRGGAWDTAEWSLSRVRGIAEACDARWLRDSALAGQRAISGLAGRMSARVTAELTRREETIAELLVAGLSNAEIAGRLHLTVKTIEAHLTRIYRKLGVRSRSAAAALLSRAAVS